MRSLNINLIWNSFVLNLQTYCLFDSWTGFHHYYISFSFKLQLRNKFNWLNLIIILIFSLQYQALKFPVSHCYFSYLLNFIVVYLTNIIHTHIFFNYFDDTLFRESILIRLFLAILVLNYKTKLIQEILLWF